MHIKNIALLIFCSLCLFCSQRATLDPVIWIVINALAYQTLDVFGESGKMVSQSDHFAVLSSYLPDKEGNQLGLHHSHLDQKKNVGY